MFRSIRWRIALSYVVLIALVAAALAIYTSQFLGQEYLDSLETELLTEVQLVAEVIGPLLLEEASIEKVQPKVEELGEILNARVTIIRADGVVLGDSYQDPARMDNHLRRPEVQAALSEGLGTSNRYSRTVSYRMQYWAVPIAPAGTLLGFARVSLSVESVESQVARMRGITLGAALIVAVAAGILALFSAERVTRPLRTLTAFAERMARGDMSGRLSVSPRDEISRLASAFNQMAAEIEGQLDNLAGQRNMLQAVMTLMADGVILTDREQRVQLINPAAATILDVDPDAVHGDSFVAVARDHQLVGIWRRCGETGEEQSGAVEMIGQRPFLHLVVTPLENGDRLVLLQDLTNIRRLETVRRDFISNISHELRTPLASLQALVETLQDGALDDPPTAKHFLDLMDGEVDALIHIVQELLELSRIESGRVPIQLVPVAVADLVEQPVKRLRPQVKRTKLKLNVDLPQDLPLVLADIERIRQVVTNLVHNAIKFTPKKGRVGVSAEQAGDEVVIKVQDTGVGIPAADLSRIFERFYKADQARSGGGTGLGLAIARNLVEAHGGRIWAESVLGEGSTFFFSLPTAET